jgi:lysophospholipase L1-like esterase
VLGAALVTAVWEPERTAAQTTAPAAEPARVLVVGDSYTTGYVEGGLGAANWVPTAVRDLESHGRAVDADVSAGWGSGYLVGGTLGRTFGQWLERAPARDYAVVVFFGSRNDRGNATAVEAAAERDFRAAQERYPGARLLVIGPPWVDDHPLPRVMADRDGVRAAATAVGATFVDPLAEGWFTGADPALIGDDRVHPTDDGHAYLARLIAPYIARELPTSHR